MDDIILYQSLNVLTFTYFVFRGTKGSGVTMMAAPPILVLMILALHLQCLQTKYLLVDTISNDKSGSVMKKHQDRPKHSAPRIKTSNKAAPIGPDDYLPADGSWISALNHKKSGLLI